MGSFCCNEVDISSGERRSLVCVTDGTNVEEVQEVPVDSQFLVHVGMAMVRGSEV